MSICISNNFYMISLVGYLQSITLDNVEKFSSPMSLTRQEGPTKPLYILFLNQISGRQNSGHLLLTVTRSKTDVTS